MRSISDDAPEVELRCPMPCRTGAAWLSGELHPGNGPRRLAGVHLGAWIAIALLAVWLRAVQMRESLWLDELHTAWTVADGWSEIGWRAAIGNQSPLYFWLVGAVSRLAGLNEVALRLPSLLAGVAVVLLGGWLVTRWTGSRSGGLLAAVLLSLDRYTIFYAQEARPYALVQLVGLIHVALFIELLQRPERRLRWLWIASALCLYYLHFTAILLLPAQLVAYGVLHVHRRWRPAYRFGPAACDAGLVLLGVLPSVPQLFRITAHRDAWSLFIPRDVPAWSILTLFPLEIYLLIPAVICMIAWAICLRRPSGRGADWVTGRPANLRAALVVLCWLFVPLSLAWIVTVCDWARLFFLRYVMVSAAAPMLLAGFVWAVLPSWRWRTVCAVAVVTATVWQGGMVGQFARDRRVIGDRRQDWRTAVQTLQQLAASSDAPVFVRSGLIEANRLPASGDPQLRQYCLLPIRGIYYLDVRDERLEALPTTGTAMLNERQVDRIDAAGEAWFLLAGRPAVVDGIEDRLHTAMLRSGTAITIERQQFGHVALLRVVVARDGKLDSGVRADVPCLRATFPACCRL